MPTLDRPLQERFAIYIAQGCSHREAYLKAGYETKTVKNIQANASKLANQPHVKRRIIELQQKQAQRIGITVEKLVEELDHMLALSIASNQPAAGVSAIMSKAKLCGLVTDRVEAEVRRPMREPGSGDKMSLDEWTKKFAPKGTVQ